MAALTEPAVGNGTTISGLGLTTLVRKVTGPTWSLGGFATPDLATTDFETQKKVTLANPGQVVVEVYHSGAALTLGATGTFTLTYPLAGSLAGTGWISDIKWPDADNGQAMITTYTVTFDGYTGPAFTAA